MSSRRLQVVSSRRFQDAFSVTIFHFPRRLQDVLQDIVNTFSRRLQDVSARRLEDVFKTSWKTKNCYDEDVLKPSSRYVLKTSSRRVEYQEMFAGIYGKLAHSL